MKNLLPHEISLHFNKKTRELFAAYTELGDKRTPYEYTLMFAKVMEYNPKAFHTKNTLALRRFYHCPRTEIPYLTCVRYFL